MNQRTFELLNDHDWEVMLEHARRLTFRRDETVIQEGSHQKALYILRAGYVRVVRAHNGQPLTYARLGPDQVFGEMSFLEHTGASASVIAEDDVEVDEIDGTHLNALLGSDPGFSARFYNSLAVTLSQRLRDMSVNLGELNVNEIAQVNRFHRTRLGHITDRQLPESLSEAVARFQSEMRDLDGRLKAASVSATEAQARVSERCDGVIAILEQYTRPETLVEIGYDDLLSFRDTANLDIGVGAYVFRETFNIFMLSETIAHCYMKPRGFADDFRTGELIFANDPRGDGRLGPYIDRWFLGRPFCVARRETHALVARALTDAGAHTGDVFHVTSLASGAARELLDVSRALGAGRIQCKCVDLDQEALAYASELAQRAGVADRFSFMQANVLALAEGRGKFDIGLQDVIYALGFVEYLTDEQAVTLLNWIHANLRAGGRALITNASPAANDRLFLNHILEWQITYRTRDELADLFSRSAFRTPPTISTDVAGGVHIAVASR